jgi:hypothetical protein
MAETREEKLARLKEEREAKLQEMAAARLSTRAAAVDPEAAKYYGVTPTPVKVGATTQERVEALKDIRAAENLATYSTASEFKAIPFDKLDPKTKGTLAANAAYSGFTVTDPKTGEVRTPTPEEYYNLRGGINQSGYYGDSYTAGLTLTEREYQTARLEGGIGTTGAGSAINLASAKKAYDYYIAQGDNPVKASIRSGYTGTKFQVKPGIGPKGENLYLYDGKYYDDAGNEVSEGQTLWANSSVVATSSTPVNTFVSTVSTSQPIISDTSTLSSTSTARSLGRDQFKNSLALFFGAAEAAKPWVDALYDVVSKFYRTGSDVNESFNLALQDARNNPALKPFTDRFKGIYALQDLKLTGKPVLVPTIAEYVVSQAKMADVLREANLGDLATDDFTTELISKGNSVTTIAEKIAKVYQRIDMAPKAIKDTLGRYFPTVDRTTLAKTLLTGQKGVDQLVDELEQYEVLAAAEQQGLGAINRIGGVDLGRAQEYARSGQTFASLTPQFSRIARALPTTTKLSEISKVEDIGQVGLEKALISQSAKELEKLQKLTEQEEARFAGKAGRLELGLASQRRANRAF